MPKCRPEAKNSDLDFTKSGHFACNPRFIRIRDQEPIREIKTLGVNFKRLDSVSEANLVQVNIPSAPSRRPHSKNIDVLSDNKSFYVLLASIRWKFYVFESRLVLVNMVIIKYFSNLI